MKTLLKALACTLLLAACSPVGLTQAEERPPVADKAVAYRGDNGVKVWTLRIGERSANQALVQVEGIDHDWNMQIRKMNVEKSNRDTRYVTEVDGKRFVAFHVQDGYGEVYLPGEAQALRVFSDNSLAEHGNAQYFLTDYLNQTTSQ
jgi:hypothetical protein